MRRPSREINIFSLSALDLFASAMGAFIVIAVVLFPYYLKTTVTPVTIESRPIDVVYVVDTTSSMGAAIAQVKGSLVGIIAILNELAPSVRVGFVAYKARNIPENEYVLIFQDLLEADEDGAEDLQAWVDRLSEQGGGQEIMLKAAETAVDMEWRSADTINLIVMVADEPGGVEGTRNELTGLRRLTEAFADGERRIVSTYVPPKDPTSLFTEEEERFLAAQREEVIYWFEQIAEVGGGVFVEASTGDLASTTLRSIFQVIISD